MKEKGWDKEGRRGRGVTECMCPIDTYIWSSGRSYFYCVPLFATSHAISKLKRKGSATSPLNSSSDISNSHERLLVSNLGKSRSPVKAISEIKDKTPMEHGSAELS